MSEVQLQVIKDVMNMIPKLSIESLTGIRNLMEELINKELIRLEPSVELKNMDITEKVMYLEFLTEGKKTKEDEQKNSLSLEEILKREGLTIDDLQDKN